MLDRRWRRGRNWAFALAALGATAVAAQPVTWDTSSWRVGDSARYEVTQERSEERAGRPSTRRVLRSDLTVRVLPPPAGAAGKRLGWRSAPKQDAPAVAPVEPQVAALLADLAWQMPELILRADTDGIPEAVDNLDQITAVLRRVVAQGLPSAPGAASAPALAPMVQELLSPSLVESAALGDGNTLLGYAGVPFKPGETLRVPQELPNPLGGPSIPAVTSVRMLEHDVKARRLRIEAVTAVDAESAPKVLAQTIEAIGRRLGSALPLGTFAKVDSRMVHKIEVDLRDGWPIRASTEREIEIVGSDGVARRFDTKVFVRQP